MEVLYQKYKDQGFIVLTLITENYDGNPPTVSQLGLWAGEYGQTFPVLSDAVGYIDEFAGDKGTVSLPVHTLLGPGAEFLVVNGEVSEAEIQAALPPPAAGD